MKSNPSSPIWPYLAILSCLFAVCVMAPRGWQRLAREESIDVSLQASRPKLSKYLRPVTTAQSPAKVATRPAIEGPTGQPNQSLAASNTAARLDGAEGSAQDQAAPAAGMSPATLADRPDRRSSADTNTLDPESPFRTAVSRTAAGAPRLAASAVSRDELSRDTLVQRLPTIESQLPISGKPAFDLTDVTPPRRTPQVTAEAAAPDRLPASGRLPRAEMLMADLAALEHQPVCGAWASAANRLLAEACNEAPDSQRPIAVVLAELRRHSQRGESLAGACGDPKLESQMLRAQYALARRLDIWDTVVLMSASAPVDGADPAAQRMPIALDAMESLTRAQREGTAWRDYLLLPRVRHLVGRDGNDSPEERRKIARHVLVRLSSLRMSREQRKFIDERALTDFRAELQHWAAEPVDSRELLVDLERYERTGSALDGQRLASNCRWLCWSGDSQSQQLGARIEEHYRNANVRVAVSQMFLSRFLPQPEASVAPVRDTIAGAQVEGQSTTYTKLALLMIPDRNRLRLGIEAHGTVQSNTSATSGPATFYNAGESHFIARKLLLFGPRGLSIFPAMSEAESTRQQLVSMETNFDRVPLLNSVVRNIARNEHEASQGSARSEVEQKIAARARLQFDGEIQPKLAQVIQKFNQRVRDPLDQLGLEPLTLGASTSEDRAVMRFRLAGHEQLAAYTPRPRAPSDSLVSLQVHQSALNNALERLELDGRTFQLDELFQHLAQKMGRTQVDLPDDLPKNVSVTFAAHDAIRLRCEDGQIEVRISLADLTERRKHWKNFVVRTYYKPDSSSLETRFVRSGGIFLEGDSLKGKTQFALRSVFSKVLSPTRHWGLIEPRLVSDPRIKDLEITQFSVEQGWIGIAYAARRQPLPVASRPH